MVFRPHEVEEEETSTKRACYKRLHSEIGRGMYYRDQAKYKGTVHTWYVAFPTDLASTQGQQCSAHMNNSTVFFSLQVIEICDIRFSK